MEEVRLHVAGATVRHSSPFEKLVSHKNPAELTIGFIDTWCNPYMDVPAETDEQILKFAIAKPDITDDIVLSLLRDFNWRTRQVGAYFAAITERRHMIDIIGVHLLKSEVCYVGRIYCLVFAYFNTPACVEYLNMYLDYYLQKKDLWFDQNAAMEAVKYLDDVNHTHHFESHYPQWLKFISNKPYWEKNIKIDNLKKQIEAIRMIVEQ